MLEGEFYIFYFLLFAVNVTVLGIDALGKDVWPDLQFLKSFVDTVEC